ncbi:MAG: hypothetical protein ABIS47_00085 [Acidimicrobiales bacterium]
MSRSPEATRQAYRIASWAMGGFAFVAAVMTFAVGLAALTAPGTAPAGGGERVTTGTAPEGPPGTVLAGDQAEVSGTVAKVTATQVEAPPLAIPLTLQVVPGKGLKAEFSGGTVGGKSATITWDGGRPLPLTGQGSLDLNGAVDVELNASGATYRLDGASRMLTPGSYTFGETVAVVPADGGLGTPKVGARLDVPAGATASVLTRGDVRVTKPAAPLKLNGPGQLVLEGSLEITTREGVRSAKKVTFGPGAFAINLEPQPGGYRVDKALLQGPITLEG